MEALLEDARKAPELYTKARRLDTAYQLKRLALAAAAKECAQMAGKTVCLIEADIAAANPPIPPKESGAMKGKKGVAPDATPSKFALSHMRRAYNPYQPQEVAAICDQAIARGKIPSREMFRDGIGAKTKTEITRERRAAVAKEKAERLAKPHDSKIKLYALPIHKLAAEIPPESVDLVFTDPPYEKPGVPVYSELSKFAGDVLKPGGSLLALSGSAWLPEIVQRICEDKRLKWQWCLKYVMGGGESRNYDRRVFTAAKLVFWLVKPPYKGYWINDKIMVPPKPKGYNRGFKNHKWAQSHLGMEAILAKGFAYPGQVVCDPFLGGGSTAVAALKRRCDFIGSDIDPAHVKAAEDELAARID